MKKLYVSSDQRFMEHDGKVYTDLAFDYRYWQEYLEVFDEVHPVARVCCVNAVQYAWQRADGARVVFRPVTNYVGFWSYLACLPRAIWDCGRAMRESHCVLLRSGTVAAACWPWLKLFRKPYAIDSVGPAGAAVRQVRNVQGFRFERLLAWFVDLLGRRIARGACCACYVSRHVQTLYPTAHRDREWVISDVQLTPAAYAAPRAPGSFRRHRPHLVTVGRLEPEKGHLAFIEALARLVTHHHLDIQATVVGPGREMERLRQQCARLGIAERVQFPGLVAAGPDLWAMLDDADVFVLPSLTEGMPRALIEAMARGLPAIATDVGGVPDLLAEGHLVPPANPEALAGRIAAVLSDPRQLAAMSERNVVRARDFAPERLTAERQAFWRCLRDGPGSMERLTRRRWLFAWGGSRDTGPGSA